MVGTPSVTIEANRLLPVETLVGVLIVRLLAAVAPVLLVDTLTKDAAIKFYACLYKIFTTFALR